MIEALHGARCYPHTVGVIDVRQTHVSWVVLTGEFAYKIKKPVKLKFLDFSSLPLRRHYCELELKLNRRFAPELYLDVVAIRGSVQSPTIDECSTGSSAEEPIEYAVKLRQFDAGCELTHLLENNAASDAELAALGRHLARVHAAAPRCDEFGSADQSARIAADNMREIEELASQHVETTRIRAWLKETFERLHEVLQKRQNEGRVRECHGDLHAGNIVSWQGRLLPFDCLEFDAKLRCIDVVNDVAFLAMDLAARGHSRLTYVFVNAWLEECGDYEGVKVLRVFQVHRAMVRAKVALLEKKEALTRNYLRVAQRLCAPAQPLLLITCGLSGSGKTWLSTRLLAELGAIRIRSDVERKRLAGLKADESSSAAGLDIYTADYHERVYARLLQCARIALEAGETVIVDAAFLKRAERAMFTDLGRELAVPMKILHCVAGDTELRRRLRHRSAEGKDASEADVAIMEQQIRWWEPFSDEEKPYVVSGTTEQLAGEALRV